MPTTSATIPRKPPGKWAPRTRPSTMMMADWMTATMPSCAMRPQMRAARLTGVTRKRSTTPRFMSSMMPMPLHPAENRQVITTMPGVRKST